MALDATPVSSPTVVASAWGIGGRPSMASINAVGVWGRAAGSLAIRCRTRSENASVTDMGPDGEEAFCYLRGQTYEVTDRAGAHLLASGRFGVAMLPPPDPLAEKRDRARALVDQLAALPESALDRLGTFIGTLSGSPSALRDLAADEKPAEVTNTEPRSAPAAPVPELEPADPKRFENPEPADPKRFATPAPEAATREQLAALTVPVLRIHAQAHGVATAGIKLKRDLISALLAANVPPPVS